MSLESSKGPPGYSGGSFGPYCESPGPLTGLLDHVRVFLAL